MTAVDKASQVRTLREQTSQLALQVPELLSIAGELYRVEQRLEQPARLRTDVATQVTARLDKKTQANGSGHTQTGAAITPVAAPIAAARPVTVQVRPMGSAAPVTGSLAPIVAPKKVSKPPPPGWPKQCDRCKKKSIKTPRGMTLHLKTCKGANNKADNTVVAANGQPANGSVSLAVPNQLASATGAFGVAGPPASRLGNTATHHKVPLSPLIGQKRKAADYAYDRWPSFAPQSTSRARVDTCEDDYDDYYDDEDQDNDDADENGDLDGFVVRDEPESSVDRQFDDDHTDGLSNPGSLTPTSPIVVTKRRRLAMHHAALDSSNEDE